MDLLKKYAKGHTVEVYEEIQAMGPSAFKRENIKEVRAILTETMNHVNQNLDIIYAALQEMDYCFSKRFHYDFEYPILKPRWGARLHIRKLEKAVRRFGYLPLSLKVFYQTVGSCNFAWDYKSKPEIPWEGADPIQIGPATDVLVEAKGLEPDDGLIGLPIAADYCIKDNISGAPQYSVELTKQPQVDSRFLNEEHDTTFIGYLRLCMENCGFSRPYAINNLPDFAKYCRKIRPRLKPI